MVFSSLEFLFIYLPCTILIYFLIPAQHLAIRNFALLITSLIFYGWSEPIYIVIMFLSIFVDYVCGFMVSKHLDSSKTKAKKALITSVVINLSVLCFFKYYDFFVSNLSLIPIFSFLKPIGLKLPVGISFYTFQTMSYTLDIYFRKARVQNNIFTFGTYVTMFPQLIAGPIVRYSNVDEELRKRQHTVWLVAKGVRRFVCGLAKKVLLANTAGAMFEAFVRDVNNFPNALAAWLGIIFYSFQIYFDFSGYSDMAIGLGYVLGFNFPENFNYPYISRSITEFWRRWHITLSTWFREYLYIPLGGNRKGLKKTFFNLFLVWLLTGLWHGASWNFVLWGLYFCILIILEKAFLLKIFDKLPSFVSRLYFIFFILIGWYIFISCDIENPLLYLSAMFCSPFNSGMAVYEFLRSVLFIVILIFACTPLPHKVYLKLYNNNLFKIVIAILLPVVFLACIAYLVDTSYNPFLYFRF